MKGIYFTVDFEDTINPKSIEVCEEIIKIFNKNGIRPIIFITGGLIKLLFKRQKRFKKVIGSIKKYTELGYHTNSHLAPVPFMISDVKNYSEAIKKCLVKETKKYSVGGQKYSIFDFFYLLFKKYPQNCRFPGFSWTPPYLEALQGLGIKNSFDLYPEKSKNLPYISTKKGIRFIQPDYILWVDEIIRKNNPEKTVKIVDSYLNKYNFLNMSIHPDRFCNKGWWENYYKKPQTLLKYSKTRIKKHLKTLEVVINHIGLKKEIIRPNLLKKEKPQEIRLSAKDIKQIYLNAFYWTKRRFNYRPKYLFKHFVSFFS